MPIGQRRLIAREAYRLAWMQFSRTHDLTPNERHTGASHLRRQVKLLSGAGHADAAAIANLALRRLSEPQKEVSRAA